MKPVMGLRSLALPAVLIAALLLVLPAGALAVDPGNSGIDEYTEGVPSAGGEKPTSGTGSGGGGASVVSPQTTEQLAKLGAEGAAAARAAEASSPDAPAGLGEAGGGSTGTGLLLPAILAMSLLAAVAFLILRRRGQQPAT